MIGYNAARYSLQSPGQAKLAGHAPILILKWDVRPSLTAIKKKRTLAEDGAGRPALLLAWYDRHRRKQPWRPISGERADPYRVWLSEIMLQQTGFKTVGPYFQKFLARWPDVDALGRASLDDVLRMGCALGAYFRDARVHA